MNPVHITKHTEAGPDRHIRIPGRLALLATRLMPAPAVRALTEKGLNLPALGAALRQNAPFDCVLEVHEHKVPTTVRISTGG